MLSPCIKWADPRSKWYDEQVVDAEDMSKRDKGTLFHKLIDSDGPEWGPIPPADVMVWLQHANRYLDQVLGPRCEVIHSELAIGVNWVTGEAEILPDVKNRGYPDRPGWQYGTADLECHLKTGELLIADWKTGGNEGAKEQLLSLACAFRKAMPDVHGEYYNGARTLCLQVNEEGVWPHEVAYTNEELQSHWDSMRFQWEDIGRRNVPTPGIHCTQLYCPHLAYCEGISEATTVAAGADKAALLPPGALLKGYQPKDVPDSDSDAGLTMSLISAAKRQHKYQEAKLKEYIANGGRVLAGEYEWAAGNNGYRWRHI